MTLREFYLRLAKIAKRYGNVNVIRWCLRQVYRLMQEEKAAALTAATKITG